MNEFDSKWKKNECIQLKYKSRGSIRHKVRVVELISPFSNYLCSFSRPIRVRNVLRRFFQCDRHIVNGQKGRYSWNSIQLDRYNEVVGTKCKQIDSDTVGSIVQVPAPRFPSFHSQFQVVPERVRLRSPCPDAWPEIQEDSLTVLPRFGWKEILLCIFRGWNLGFWGSSPQVSIGSWLKTLECYFQQLLFLGFRQISILLAPLSVYHYESYGGSSLVSQLCRCRKANQKDFIISLNSNRGKYNSTVFYI